MFFRTAFGLSLVLLVGCTCAGAALCEHVAGAWSGQSMREIGIGLHAWLADVAKRAHVEWHSTVYFVVTDRRFSGAFANVVASAEQLMGILPVVIALDEETLVYFLSRGVPVTCHAPSSPGQKEQAGHLLRYVIGYHLLNFGVQVVYADIDVFLTRNPLELINEEVDLWVEGHTYDQEVCAGFFIANPVTSTALLLHSVAQWIDAHDHLDTHTRAIAFDYAIRGQPNYGIPGEGASGQQLKLLEGHRVRWAFLPIQQVMHYTSPRGAFTPAQHLCMDDTFSSASELVAVHLWGQAGEPEARILLACALGFWHSSNPPRKMTISSVGCRWCAHGWRERISLDRYVWCVRHLNGSINSY